MLQPKLFQSFQPICGVRARPLSSAAAGDVSLPIATTEPAASTAATAKPRILRI